jgi:hypothetical protein
MIFISALHGDLTNIVERVGLGYTCQLNMGMEEGAGSKRTMVGGHDRIPRLEDGREFDMC